VIGTQQPPGRVGPPQLIKLCIVKAHVLTYRIPAFSRRVINAFRCLWSDINFSNSC
jgi:hypothetical protein